MLKIEYNSSAWLELVNHGWKTWKVEDGMAYMLPPVPAHKSGE